MANSNTPDSENITYDAQQLTEDITAGEEKSPQVNVEADYERSKQFDVSEIDRTGAGAAAADAATSTSKQTTTSEAEEGDPADFLKMAKDVTPTDEK